MAALSEEGGGGGQTRQRRKARRKTDLDYEREARAPDGSLPFTYADREKKAEEFNDLLTYDGKEYLGRTTQPEEENWYCMGFLVFCLLLCFVALYVVVFHFPAFHYNLSHAYARMGHAHAQHVVGERLLHGKGVEKDEDQAMEWFRKAASQGHPHASYNLAIGHLNGYNTDVQPGEVHNLIKHAHENGVREASDVLHNACLNGICD